MTVLTSTSGRSNVRLKGAAFAVATAALTLVPLAQSQAAPSARLWQRWTAHQASSRQTIDHSVWDRLLRKHLVVRRDAANLLHYSRFTQGDRAALNQYISRLAATPISRYNRREQLAYWINLYNALTVQVVLSRYPVRSIRRINISPGLFSTGPWRKKLLTVEGQRISLDDIEHRILRPIWKDPRIHYAVNCASIGCPDLQRRAVTAANANDYLDRGARSYINDPRGAQVVNGRLYASSIYRWFEDDFGGNEAGVIRHLKRYARPQLARALENITSIRGFRYNWNLNDASPRRRARSRGLGGVNLGAPDGS